jgi:hypothetical protein
VTNALNFETPDCQVVGGCDLYTTKAAGSDKKLYKNIENSLESQYESLLRFSASLSPPQASSAAASLNLSRSSPFGPLSQISSRRTFAYLIATLNASHPDYDFSHLLRPTDFRREKSLRLVMNTLDTTLYNLRPRPSNLPSTLSHWSSAVTPTAPPTPGGSQPWSPKMWQIIDKEMSLRECSIYCYAPEDDPYDSEDGAIWSFNYFFFNKTKKRVCYIYLRGLSMVTHSPVLEPQTPSSTIKRSADGQWGDVNEDGAVKRARYWLGDRAAIASGRGFDDDDEGGDDVVEEVDLWEHHKALEKRLRQRTDSFEQRYALSADEAQSPSCGRRSRSKSTVRGMSEDIAESMEV